MVGPQDFLSTNLNSRIDSYDKLGERIFFELGYPMVNMDLACTQAYDFIAQAIELFTKYAGYTEEYLLFKSELYTKGYGIKMDDLFSQSDEAYSTHSTGVSALSGQYIYDQDLETQRKVIDIFSIEQGASSGINTLFTVEQSLAQQTQFAYGLGSKGFDLITWHILKDWLETRQKVLALKSYVRFDARTQILRLIPEPRDGETFIGLLGCYVERPIYQIVKERWVKEYAKALVKMAIAHTRGKFGGVTLFGSGSLNASDLMTQGIAEKERLEKDLMTNYEDAHPPMFFTG